MGLKSKSVVGGGGGMGRLQTRHPGPAFEKVDGNMQGLSWRVRQAPQD